MNNKTNQPNNKTKVENNKNTTVFFSFWYFFLCAPLLLYGFFFIGGLNPPNEFVIIGLLGLIPQIFILIKSYKQAHSSIPLSKAYLTLIGGSLLLLFIWSGGCIFTIVLSVKGSP